MIKQIVRETGSDPCNSLEIMWRKEGRELSFTIRYLDFQSAEVPMKQILDAAVIGHASGPRLSALTSTISHIRIESSIKLLG